MNLDQSRNISDPTKLFQMLKEKASEQSHQGGGIGNILKLQRGKTYSLRLLWLPSTVGRQNPMINQYVHRIWNENAANGMKGVEVQCPTSQYDLDSKGFKECPICAMMSDFYKASQEGSESAGELYKKFKRTFKGYVPVYVVNGPAEDLHKVKIMPYTIMFKNYFDAKIFGLKPQTKGQTNDSFADEEFDESNTVGLEGFMYYDPNADVVKTSGYNFIVQVGTKRITIGTKQVEMPDYKLDFSMKKTDIPDFDGVEVTPEYFKRLTDDLGFDRNFYIMHDPQKLLNFKAKYIDGKDSASDDTLPFDRPIAKEAAPKKAAPAPVAEEAEEEPAPKKQAKKQAVVEEEEDPLPFKTEPKAAPKAKPAPKEEAPEPESSDDDDIDLDELLKDI